MPRSGPTTRPLHRAVPHTRGARRASPLLLLAALAGACGEDPAPPPPGPGPAAAAGVPASVEQALRDLVAALTPPPADAPGTVQDDWLRRYRLKLSELERWPVEYGEAALARFLEGRDTDLSVRIGLLKAAAIAAPEATTPTLEALVLEYGEDLAVRELAPELLARAAPERALEILEPLLLERRPTVTRPPRATILDGWLDACRRTGRDPAQTLSLVATDIFMDEETRNVAVREIAKHPGPAARHTLRTVLTESTGNAYLRRLAAQGVPVVYDAAEACALLEEVLGLEADLNMQRFLLDLVEDHCP